MTAAIQKTANLVRCDVPVGSLEPNPLNPNEMGDREFNLLVDNMEKVGFTDPILVRIHPEHEGKYRIIGGAHRWEVAKLLGFETVPVTIVDSNTLSDDEEKAQIVRHNIIRGKMSPQKFMHLYDSLGKTYSDEIAAEMFGFVDEEDFKKLIGATEKALPDSLKKQFKDAAKELKTVDDLAKVLNTLFSQGGDTLPYGYMIFDFEGKTNIWLRMRKSQKDSFDYLADKCKAHNKNMAHVMYLMMKSVESGALDSHMASWLDNADAVTPNSDG